jgi:hypothetical protein
MTAPVNHVALVNRSRGLLPDSTLAATVEAYRESLPAFCAAWSLPLPGLAVYPSDHLQVPEEEACIFIVDSAGDPGAFGAHTQIGKYTWGYVDAGLAMAREEPISRVIGHELFELIADPGLDRWADVGGGERVAIEVSDPCERQGERRLASFFGTTAVVEIADWVTPAFYDPTAGHGPFDRLQIIEAPLTALSGGYITRKQAGAIVVEGAARVSNFGRTFRRLARG